MITDLNIDVQFEDDINIDIAIEDVELGDIGSKTCQELNDELKQSQRDEIHSILTIQTGQTTSFESFDDGATQNGRLVDFFTLKCNNIHGNTDRFTNSKGGAVQDGSDGSLVDYVEDHASPYAWKRTVQAGANFEDQLSAADGLTFATFSNWLVGNVKEYMDIVHFNSDSLFDYAPFDITVATNSGLWTSTTRSTAGSSRGVYYRVNLPTMAVNILKTTLQGALVRRNHNLYV